MNKIAIICSITTLFTACNQKKPLHFTVYQTSAKGDQLTEKTSFNSNNSPSIIDILPDKTFQTITGFGGSFTQASAHLLNLLGEANRQKILEAYFSEKGANYSLTRTHINSCDFSLYQYAYNNVPGDVELKTFDISEDQKALIPIIKEAQKISKNGFKIISSPWTAPPWMKDNNSWVGGKLLPKYYAAWALYFSKYLTAYEKEGIHVWGVTVENEPHGNGNNWESMLFSPKEMTDFVEEYLGPQLHKDGHKQVKILGYDQNRAGLKEWVDEMYRSENSSKYFAGTAIHWYESTYDFFGAALQYAHEKMPGKYLINTEACVDSEVPKWMDNNWYWSKEATDWGWDWASEKEKYLHPKYAPVNRYAEDIIGCLNNNVDGWIDWNMVLNKQGGPNWFKNWCTAPVIVDEEKDLVYFTPLYYTMSHFSKFIRPNAVRIGVNIADSDLKCTAALNPDGTIAIVLFNPTDKEKSIHLKCQNAEGHFSISAKAIQTIIIHK